MYVFIGIILIILVLIILLLDFNKKNNYENICKKKLSNIEYLQHMIPHHQVAIDISKLMQEKTENPELQKILRELIWNQEKEIMFMYIMLYQLPQDITDSKIKINEFYIATIADFIKPNVLGISNNYCDPLFFDPSEHMKHIKEHSKHLDDTYYINHMIPHHQVAVDMSKILIKNTNNDMMRWLAYRIIRSQHEEIIILDNLKKSKFIYKSHLIK